MKNLLQYIIENIVQNPKAVTIEEEKAPSGLVIFHLSVDPSDMGRIIGKEGKIIKAIRNVMKIRGLKENLRFSIDLKETSQTD